MRFRITSACLATVLALPMLTAPAIAQGGTSVHVCVGVDHVLRFVPGTACPAGQASYTLALDGTQPTPPNEDENAAKEIADLKKSLDFLRTRVSNLEAELGEKEPGKDKVSHLVSAPFVVVDKSGNAIFVVTDQPNDIAQTKGRVQVGPGGSGNYVIGVRSASGGFAAAIGDAKTGGGGLNLYDAAGKRSVEVKGGVGFVLLSPAENEIARIGLQSGNTERSILKLSGTFNILNRTGQVVVEGGASDKAGGVMRVGTSPSCLPLAGLKVPDCIMGKAP